MSQLTEFIKNHAVVTAVSVLAALGIAIAVGRLWCVILPCPDESHYLKIEEPPDVDKEDPGDKSCWAATAGNMLAGAGYGVGEGLTVKAKSIYDQLLAEEADIEAYQLDEDQDIEDEDVKDCWLSTAIDYWLKKYGDDYENLSYTCYATGKSNSCDPVYEPELPKNLAQWLRNCDFIGLGIRDIPNYHDVTLWGDDWDEDEEVFPAKIWITDSDYDYEGDIKDYTYDNGFYWEQSGGNPDATISKKDGWFIDYDVSNHHYGIYYAVQLTQLDEPTEGDSTSINIGSYAADMGARSAMKVDYALSSSRSILKYHPPKMFRDPSLIPLVPEAKYQVTDTGPGRKTIHVEWDFSQKPLQGRTRVYISQSAVLFKDSALKHENLFITYKGNQRERFLPDISWSVKSDPIENAYKIPNVIGGFIIGSFRIYKDRPAGDPRRAVAEYRFVHQYPYDRDPENHTLSLAGSEGYYVGDMKFSHSYGAPSVKVLWKMEDKEFQPADAFVPFRLDEVPKEIEIELPGLSKYPKKRW